MFLKIFRILITFQIHLPGLAEGQLHEVGLNLQIGSREKTVLQKNVHQMACKRKERQEPHNGKNRLKGCGGLDLIEHISHHDHPEDQPLRPVRHGINHNGRDSPRGNFSNMPQQEQIV